MVTNRICGRIVIAAIALYTNGVSTTWAQSYVGIDLYSLHSPFGTPITLPIEGASIASRGQVVGYAGTGPQSGPNHGLLWTASGAVVDLTPAGVSAQIYGTDGMRQVGSSTAGHAYLWIGTLASAIDLHPTNLTGWTNSIAYGVSDSEQVGAGFSSPTGGVAHALLWHGTANSAIDLHPTNLTGFQTSVASGTDGESQVGAGSGPGTGSDPHALLWRGTGPSAVDLNPTTLGYSASFGVGVSGTQQVGSGSGSATGDNLHALVWTGTADSAVDLHPTNLTGFLVSTAFGTNGTRQVGYAADNNRHDAMLWSGTATSAVDLNSLLPFESGSSTAYTIDSAGNIWGTATDSTGAIHAVEWSPVPEPTAWVLAGVGLATMIAVGCLKRAG